MKTNINNAKFAFSFSPLGSNQALNDVIIGVGASTGGTDAVLEVLRMLPEDMPGIVVVQHMPAEGQLTAYYAGRLNQQCRMEVREARNDDRIKRGTAYIAPAGCQTRIIRSGQTYYLQCIQEGNVNGHQPSVDVLFRSMAENVQCKMIGIIMTGMGADGAKGLLAMHEKGAYTIGQNKETSVAYGMPCEALKLGAVDVQSPCRQIAGLLIQYLKNL